MMRWLGVTLVGVMVVACGDDSAATSTMHAFHGDEDAGACAAGETACGDHRDDDCDTLVDCADDECAGDPTCVATPCTSGAVPEACWDDWDDDCDGLPDCADDDCARSVQCNTSCRCLAGAARWCETASDSTWGRQTCNPDGSWNPCAETIDRPGGCGASHYDPECCAAADDACCQDSPASGSIGACGDAITCG